MIVTTKDIFITAAKGEEIGKIADLKDAQDLNDALEAAGFSSPYGTDIQ